MRVLKTIVLCLICSFAYAQECDVSKVDEEGCLVDEKSFTNLVDRLCDIEKSEDENTQYKFNIDCEDGAFLFEVVSSDGSSDDTKKIDINECVDDNQEIEYNPETKRLTLERGGFADLSIMPTWTTLTAPTILVTGTATETLQQVLETDTEWYTQRDGDCREKYYFQYRIRVNQATTNGWALVRVPNIGGWDRRVFDIGTYRQTGNLNNPGDDDFGAMPNAPYMGAEAHEWSNTGVIYLNQFNQKDNAATSMWVEFVVEYKRN